VGECGVSGLATMVVVNEADEGPLGSEERSINSGISVGELRERYWVADTELELFEVMLE
jgi:hypothetical protein